ncbi:MAG: 7-carboxy-7-deazaguanine synthase [Deltaproteobacteria bacterium]
MSYAVKELYYTLQGEGARVGRAAVFCRFTGCNLWSGREADRAAAACNFCDTDFVGTDGPGGGRFADCGELADAIVACWQPIASSGASPYVVFTGGEPLLQLDAALIEACHKRGFEVAVETNGTIEAPPGIDWLTVSPKPGSELVVRSGHELKLVFPQAVTPEMVEHLAFELFYLQPLDGPGREQATGQAVAFCRDHPRWRLSLQTHKSAGFP